MFVELVYDKRNVEELTGAKEIILTELTRRVHTIFPDAEVRVKPMQANAVNSDCTKNEKEKLNRLVEEMVIPPFLAEVISRISLNTEYAASV